MAFTLSLLGFEDSEKSGGQEAELSLTGIWESGDHFSHGRLSTHTGQPVIIGEQKPGRTKGAVSQKHFLKSLIFSFPWSRSKKNTLNYFSKAKQDIFV